MKSSLMRVGMLSAAIALTGVGCANIDYEKARADAGAAVKKAKSVNGEWRDVGKILKKADKAADKGDYAQATKLANKAKAQGELGYAQAMAQKNADGSFLFK